MSRQKRGPTALTLVAWPRERAERSTAVVNDDATAGPFEIRPKNYPPTVRRFSLRAQLGKIYPRPIQRSLRGTDAVSSWRFF